MHPTSPGPCQFRPAKMPHSRTTMSHFCWCDQCGGKRRPTMPLPRTLMQRHHLGPGSHKLHSHSRPTLPTSPALSTKMMTCPPDVPHACRRCRSPPTTPHAYGERHLPIFTSLDAPHVCRGLATRNSPPPSVNCDLDPEIVLAATTLSRDIPHILWRSMMDVEIKGQSDAVGVWKQERHAEYLNSES
ncbi:uncharacterized protein [Narcine bancroftii]|uniref:uncharacterized protein isoform X2 n=1 Tax=Narcine bancroftii TaxID=1343680 RepID=UPI0038315ADD